MPGRDGTGPLGAGAMTGRGMGFCASPEQANYRTGRRLGFGIACRRGYGRGYGRGINIRTPAYQTSKELLEEQRDVLKSRLDIIDKKLENM